MRSAYSWAGKIQPWCLGVGGLLLVYGLVDGLWWVPPDVHQGDAFRIIYVHVPSAVLSLLIYLVMATAGAIALISNRPLPDMIAKQSAPLGATFTALALITGSLWGKPMWGTWWIWDARLTSELMLLFLYFGYMALRSAMPDRDAAARASAILAIVGAVDIPIIHYSVTWWHSLHQSSTLLKLGKPAMPPILLYPLLAMLLAFFLYYLGVLSMRLRAEILARERKSPWVLDEIGVSPRAL